MKTLVAFAMCLSVVALSACGSTREGSGGGGETTMEKPAEPGPGIPPNHARIIGTVLSIDQTLSSNAEDPCSKVPCAGTIRVEAVLGYGSAFTTRMPAGKEIAVRFQYTVSPATAFPEMDTPLPALSPGTRFQADVMQVATIADENKPEYVVGRYELR